MCGGGGGGGGRGGGKYHNNIITSLPSKIVDVFSLFFPTLASLANDVRSPYLHRAVLKPITLIKA